MRYGNKPRSYSPASSLRHSSSSDTCKASDNLIAVDTLHSPVRSTFSMVRIGTSLRRDRAGTVSPFDNRIDLRFIPCYSFLLFKIRQMANNPYFTKSSMDGLEKSPSRIFTTTNAVSRMLKDFLFIVAGECGILEMSPREGGGGYFRLLDLFRFLSRFSSWLAVRLKTKISSKSFIISSFSFTSSPPFYSYIIPLFKVVVNKKKLNKSNIFLSQSLAIVGRGAFVVTKQTRLRGGEAASFSLLRKEVGSWQTKK